MKCKCFFAALLAICIAVGSWPVITVEGTNGAATPQALNMMSGATALAAGATLNASTLTAQSAILIDADTGKMLFEKNADVRRANASTTKIMTLLLAVEHGGLDKMVTVPSSAGTAPAGSSLVPVYEGEKMPMRDLLYGLMIKSGNDAANAIGTLVSGSVASFVAAMNKKAETIGLKDTHFANPHGFPADGHYTTARDLAKLSRVALGNSTFKKIASAKSYTMKATSRRAALKLNKSYAILDKSSTYYYPYAFGLKTGYAQASGQCFVGAATKGGKTLISVVLHSAQTKPEKWVDTKKMFEYGFGVLGA